MKETGFTQAELLPYIGTFICVAVVLVYNYRRGYQYLWSPLSILSIIFAYYCLLGPYEAVSSGKTFDRLVNMRPYYESAFWGALVLIGSCIAGFHIKRSSTYTRITPPYSAHTLFVLGRNICITGFLLFTISTGGGVLALINPLDAEGVGTLGGSFYNYLGLSLNFLIPGLALLFVYSLYTGRGWVWFIAFLVIALGIYTTLGFRYRLVLLIGSLAICYYLTKKRRPNILVATAAFLVFIALMGIINETRMYGRGLDTSRFRTSKQSYFESGLNESRIFQTSGAVIDLTPSRIQYVGFTPIINTLLFPIPSGLFPEKKSAEYLFDALDAIYGGEVSRGAAFMSYGEYYLAFGWFGVIIGGFLIGWFYKKLWIWYLSDYQNPLHIAVYSITAIYLYVIISRGYLPQVTMLFFFSVVPVYVARWVINRKHSNAPVRRRMLITNENYSHSPQPGQN